MTFDLHDYRTEIGHCADRLRAALEGLCAPDAFAADLRLAADAARNLCDCEPAAWGDVPAAIARLLLPHQAPTSGPSVQSGAASYWALHLFALLSGLPTIQRALIDIAPASVSGEGLTRLRKRLDELLSIVDAIKRLSADLSPYARITFQLIDLNASLMRAAIVRERVDLRLIEYAANDIATRAKSAPTKAAPKVFVGLAECAEATVWETNRLIQAQRPGIQKRVA